MLLKEKASHWLYLPVVIMLVMLLLTQSRGPIIALVLAVGCTLHLHVFTRRNLLIAAALAVLVALLLVMTPVGDMLLARFRGAGHPKRAAPEHLAPYAVGDGQPAVAGARFQL
ncbi:polymerase [Klebsiella pneumoniae subsp. ozaenae]|uniref:Polymerase n=1 Tax=Klebsiella pneumoniae subsp. ozaenae TaxID=574 RepID=A0A377YVW5_KLEPO|nr:polymerase [Klebsiella pneumoniae subsp. ozaenae]